MKQPKAQPSSDVLQICSDFYPWSCNGCPISIDCFKSSLSDDHYQVLNEAAAKLKDRKS